MKLFEISNSYYRVEKPFKVWALKGYKPSNHYYGSARLHKPEYEILDLEKDDEIHDLVGGTFAVTVFDDGVNVYEISVSKPEDFSPFEKNYGSANKRQSWDSLISSGSIVEIKPTEAEKVKYR